MVKDDCWQEWDDGFSEGWCLGIEAGVRTGYALCHAVEGMARAIRETDHRRRDDEAYARCVAKSTAHRDFLRQVATRKPESDPE